MLGLGRYNIVLESVVISVDLKKIGNKDKSNIKKAIGFKLKDTPSIYSFPLRKPLGNYRKLRVGKYRVIFYLDQQKKECLIIGIRHRGDIYEKVAKRIK